MALNAGNGIMLYTPQDAARMLDVPLSSLNWWAKTGFIAPSVAGSRGKGKLRFYSFQDLVALKIASQLRKAGISLQALRRVVDYLRTMGPHSPLTQTRILITDDDVVGYDEQKLVSLLRNPGQGIFKHMVVVEIDEVVKELKEDAENQAAA